MDYNELIVDLHRIPTDRRGISDNLTQLLEHVKYLAGRNDVTAPLERNILDVAPPYIQKQIERLLLHVDDDPDIVAWISRGLMELLFILRYMYGGKEKYDEFIKEQLKDLKDIEKILYPGGAPLDDAPEAIKTYHVDMGKLWEVMKQYGVNQDELAGAKQVRHFAEAAGLIHLYERDWKIHSKYVHPTSYLLFGKKSSVYGEDVRLYFWILAQFYAARNLRDLHKMIEAAVSREPS
jgi:hypothetical protein